MSTSTTPGALTPATEQQSVWKHGVIAAIVAAIATTILAAIASAAGVEFKNSHGKDSIPIPTFTVFTLIFSLIGVAIAAVIARKASRPRSTFLRVVIVLLVLSLIPDLTFGFDAGSAITLMLLHLVAAAIVVPTLLRCLPAERVRAA